MTVTVIRTLLAVAVLAGGARQQAGPPRNPVVVFETGKGAIEMEVDAMRAPATAANFLKIQVIQFQSDAARRREQFPPVVLERTSVTGLKHVDGTISMARSSRPDTATASFSIVIGDQPEMDFGGRRSPDGQGFAAFGRVLRGMDVVKAIQASPTGQRGDYGTESLDPPIRILKAYRR